MKILTKHMSEKRCVFLLLGIIFVSTALFHSGCGNPSSEEGEDNGGYAQFQKTKQNEKSESGKIKKHKYLSEHQDAIFQEFLRLFGTFKNGQLALVFSGIYGAQPIDLTGTGVRQKMPKYLGLMSNRPVEVFYDAEIIIYQDKSYSMKFTALGPNKLQQLQSLAFKAAGHSTPPWDIAGMVDTQTGIIEDIILYDRGPLDIDLGIKLKANSIEERARSINGIPKDSYYSCNLRFKSALWAPKGEIESVAKVFMNTKFPDARFFISEAELPSAVETNSPFLNKYEEFLFNFCYDEKQKKLWKDKKIGRQLDRIQAILIKANPDYRGQGRLHEQDGVIVAAEFPNCSLRDLSPLKGLKLQMLDLSGNPVREIRHLQGMPLNVLWLENTQVVSLKSLSNAKLRELRLNNSPVESLDGIQGQPLEKLYAVDTRIKEVEPLRKSSLSQLWLTGSPVADLAPLAGLPLESLNAHRTLVNDLSFVRKLPAIQRLHIGETLIDDLSPLEGLTLSRLVFTPNRIQRGIEAVQRLQGLREIGIASDDQRQELMPPEQFWAQYKE